MKGRAKPLFVHPLHRVEGSATRGPPFICEAQKPRFPSQAFADFWRNMSPMSFKHFFWGGGREVQTSQGFDWAWRGLSESLPVTLSRGS